VDPEGSLGDNEKTVTEGPVVVEWDPYVIWAGDVCTTLTNDLAEVEARARRHLNTQSSHMIEEILWTNQVDGADFGDTHPNVSLSDAELPVTSSSPEYGKIYTPNSYDSYPIVTAFTDLIDALTDTLGGARGMIHVEKRLIPHIAFSGLAVQNGRRLVTTLGDHVVVPGTGYTGSAPGEGPSSRFYSWIYGTSMVEVLLGPIEVFTDQAQSVNRTSNLVEYRAERIALAHWDRQAHIGIPVCLEDPLGDCSDSGS